jgi:hypothetical protein
MRRKMSFQISTSYYFTKQTSPNESLFFKMEVIDDMIEPGVMGMVIEKLTINIRIRSILIANNCIFL